MEGYTLVRKETIQEAIKNYLAHEEVAFQQRLQMVEAIHLSWWDKLWGVSKNGKYFDAFSNDYWNDPYGDWNNWINHYKKLDNLSSQDSGHGKVW